ncbi:MAG: hypothetical protein IPH18_03980 [Chitinophagaceae bacterium]|nr:hypothetical protein [Chitinophagaceae bacterium]
MQSFFVPRKKNEPKTEAPVSIKQFFYSPETNKQIINKSAGIEETGRQIIPADNENGIPEIQSSAVADSAEAGIKIRTEIKKAEEESDLSLQADIIATDSLGATSVNSVSVEQSQIISEQVINNNKSAIKKPVNKKSNAFFVTASFAPDVSFVGGDKIGKAKLITGIGTGYQFNNRLAIRTGFYTGRKVYTASGSTYNPPPVFYQYYPILENVDADCMVYEIPLSVSYYFGRKTMRNWFVAGGISSLLMKKEFYEYSYKYTATVGHPGMLRSRT